MKSLKISYSGTHFVLKRDQIDINIKGSSLVLPSSVDSRYGLAMYCQTCLAVTYVCLYMIKWEHGVGECLSQVAEECRDKDK